MTTTAPGCSAFQARSWSALIESASEQPAPRSGISTVFSGERTEAVSAMKWTPQNSITVGVGLRRLAREAERVADEVGDVLELGQLVVVGEDHRVALGGERADLVAQLAISSSLSLAGSSLRVGSSCTAGRSFRLMFAWPGVL